MLDGKRILLIISGGIAAYKALDLLRRLKERGVRVRVVLTKGGAQFVTPLAVASLSGEKVYQDLFSLTDESEMGHIRLSREADLIVVAPASADLMAKMAAGLADDLATTALLATDKPVLLAPAMNVAMWENPATRANVALLEARGITRVGPATGDLACGETGPGRMAEPEDILGAIEAFLAGPQPLRGRRALVTSGPTREAIDPVRYLSNLSSSKQGHAIARALAQLGAETVLVTGPTRQTAAPHVQVRNVTTAEEMLAACEAERPIDVAVCAAAVSDWRPTTRPNQKLKKKKGATPVLELQETPDILARLSAAGPTRPSLVIGFAAETENLIENAREKRTRKGCDWILANDVSEGSNTLGGDSNRIHFLTKDGIEDWPEMSKDAVATTLAQRIVTHFEGDA
ncbi:MAG: bifunctional phosphopantothenoylcysteine decarboxylase/phosphopantothenate--cysteine ligase CoaBC [Rhodospirillaceae bacterium]|nr:MAG: bifunctional phosphopantothenoylcysteine decarboxylase/phosphopantothenate--cysteine ligase CoaBC [Rhodospirillaceae bacterium]